MKKMTLLLALGMIVPAHAAEPARDQIGVSDQKLSVGGYGEAVYQSFDTQRDDGSPSGRRDRADFLRFVLTFGYQFSDRFVFHSGVEIEHAGEDERDGINLENAALDFLIHPLVNLRGGLLLIPMGFLNERHEPPLFHGANRPNVERDLIPTTWRENGFGVFGDLGPIRYRTYLVNGLQGASDFAVAGSSGSVTGFDASTGLRNGRQNGSNAYAENLGWVTRLDYTGVPGLLMGGSYYLGESGQNVAVSGRPIAVRTDVWELHGEYAWRGLELRGLYVRVDLEDVALLNQAQGVSGNASIGERMAGGYAQAAYDVLPLFGWKHYLAPFFRYERINTQARVPEGFSSDPANDRTELTFGMTYKPLLSIVLKGDYQNMKNRAGTGVDQWNLAFGYLF